MKKNLEKHQIIKVGLIFTEAKTEEKSVVEYMLECSKMCYGKSTKDFRELADEMAKVNNKKMQNLI